MKNASPKKFAAMLSAQHRLLAAYWGNVDDGAVRKLLDAALAARPARKQPNRRPSDSIMAQAGKSEAA